MSPEVLKPDVHCASLALHTPAGLQAAAAFGGLSKFDQVKELKAGCEIAICTPGRMIDLIKMKACTLGRVTYLVLDEADRMLDMGFEAQVGYPSWLLQPILGLGGLSGVMSLFNQPM
jgi:ATP-dependent RNA helicase DDX42